MRGDTLQLRGCTFTYNIRVVTTSCSFNACYNYVCFSKHRVHQGGVYFRLAFTTKNTLWTEKSSATCSSEGALAVDTTCAMQPRPRVSGALGVKGLTHTRIAASSLLVIARSGDYAQFWTRPLPRRHSARRLGSQPT